jgi:D-xylose transport system ATP-binding protein
MGGSADGPPLLELRAVSKSFGAVQVLYDVDFVARAGEVTALVGDNGAGKSTLIKCVGGIHPFDSGQILFEGREASVHSPKEASGLGIEIVYQDLALCDNLDIVQNMFLGRERRDRLRLLDEDNMETAARKTLLDLGVTTVRSVRTAVAQLSGGQRQSVAVAKVVMWRSQLAILDEPTAALGVGQTAQVLALVRRLSENGLGVILISHNLNDVFAVSDRIAVLRLGRMVANVAARDVNSQEVVELITTGRSSRSPALAGSVPTEEVQA